MGAPHHGGFWCDQRCSALLPGMGYTNYFHQHRPFTPQEWYAIATDAKAIVAEAKRRGVKIAGWDGHGKPEFGEGRVAFNGAGDDQYESFVLEADPGPGLEDAVEELSTDARLFAYLSGQLTKWQTEHTAFNFCKTGRKPYDGVVKAVLARAHFIAPDAVDFCWDGTLDEYMNGADAGPWNPSTPSPSASTYVRAIWPDHYDAMLARVERCAADDPDNSPWPEPWSTLVPDTAIELDPGDPPPARRGPGSNQYQDKPPRPRSGKR